MIITKTPYRFSLFGGGTDYPEWYFGNPSRVLTSSMRYYCYISLRALPPFFNHKTRVVYSKIEDVKGNENIEHPAVNACLKFLKVSDGLEIHYDGDLPSKSGIGSSSAFTVGFLNALYGYMGKMITPERLAIEALEVERDLLNENVGIQDQISAAYGGFNVIDMGPGHRWKVRPLIIQESYMHYLEESLILGFSGKNRLADEHAFEKVENIKKEKTTHELDEIRAISERAISMIGYQEDLDELGKLMKQSWEIKRRLSKSLSDEKTGEIMETGFKAGALGGKLMGAGGGGFFYFLAPKKLHKKIKDALPQIPVWVPVKFDSTGSQVIFHN